MPKYLEEYFIAMSQNRTYKDVLIIDDDPVFQEIARAFLVQIGAGQVLQAMNGKQAVEEIIKPAQRIGFILCDLHMPVTNGIEFLEFASRFRCRIPLAIVSNANKHLIRSAESLAVAFDLNFVGTLRKPIDFDKLKHITNPYLA